MGNTHLKGDVVLVQRVFNTYLTNDIVYFRFPVKDSTIDRTYCFQRLIGLPGDTLEINNKAVMLNNFTIEDTSSVKHNYYVKATVKLDSTFKLRYGLFEGGEISNDLDYSFSLTKAQLDSLKHSAFIDKITPKIEQKASFDQTVFPYSIHYSWNLDQFGKLYIPKKNDTLALDSIKLNIYSSLIRDYENNRLEIKNDTIWINEAPQNYYVVKQNYYFVLGDNRDNANDSRVFGFLPENYLRGKVIKVIKQSQK